MIYTIGYQQLTPAALARHMHRLRIDLLVDVRAKPWSRKPGFSRTALERTFGTRYHWAGDQLGGPGGGGAITPRGLAELREHVRAGKRLLLMCLEHAPGDCHRHAIAVRLLPDVETVHVYEGEGVTAAELQRAIEQDTDYDVVAL